MSLRIVVTAVMLALALSGCSIFEKKKIPLEGERVSVFSGRDELDPLPMLAVHTTCGAAPTARCCMA
jgi:uncharacterized protein YceK